MTLEDKKALAKAELNRTRGEFVTTRTEEAWKAFCEAKRLCRFLGVIF